MQDGIVTSAPVKGNASVYTRCVYLSVPSGFSAFGKLMCSSSGTFAPWESPVQTLTNGVPFGWRPESTTNPVCAFEPPVEQLEGGTLTS